MSPAIRDGSYECALPLGLPSGEQTRFDQIPELQARLGSDEHSQRSPYRRAVIVILGLHQSGIFRWSKRAFPHDRWGA